CSNSPPFRTTRPGSSRPSRPSLASLRRPRRRIRARCRRSTCPRPPPPETIPRLRPSRRSG
ncbi:MAG: hypothetical protein AVDCRST_MAG31-1943, partial [uncultured Sphingomonas sp.]